MFVIIIGSVGVGHRKEDGVRVSFSVKHGACAGAHHVTLGVPATTMHDWVGGVGGEAMVGLRRDKEREVEGGSEVWVRNVMIKRLKCKEGRKQWKERVKMVREK